MSERIIPKTNNLGRPPIDRAGKSYGELTALYIVRADPQAVWLCQCSCGKQVEVRSSSLGGGHTKSCGCRMRVRGHGKTGTLEWKRWYTMWRRCTDKNNKAYELYKNRTPPEQWKDFSVFLSDMGPIPSEKHTVERIDNDKPYGPDNCKWATMAEQRKNTSSTIWVMCKEVKMTTTDACALVGICSSTVFHRYSRSKDMLKASNGLFDICL